MQEDGTLPGSGPKVNLSAFHCTISTLSYHVNDNTIVKIPWDLKSIGQEQNYTFVVFIFICFKEGGLLLDFYPASNTAPLKGSPARKSSKNVERKRQRQEFKS